MEVITTKEEIRNCHELLKARLEKHRTASIKALIGHKGSSYTIEVAYSRPLNLWWSMDKTDRGNSGVRYWNVFGTGKPVPGKLANIIGEINYPEEGINKRVAAAWVNQNQKKLLVHDGNIGGGRKGIGKNGFKRHYYGTFIHPEIEQLAQEVTVISSLNDVKLPDHISTFIHEVERIKATITSEQKIKTDNTDIDTSFNPEFFGEKSYQAKSQTITQSANHGLVINQLKDELEKREFLVDNTREMDLFILDENKKITHLFEAKTALLPQCIYTAVGQLYFHSSHQYPLPKLIFVLPEQKQQDQLFHRLEQLNIHPLVYHWKKKKPLFKNLDKLL